MPKRLIDGDALWTSNKVSKLETKYIPEYSWLLPLAEANGCFECDARQIWAKCYAMLRPGWTQEDVEDLLDAFETAKLLFKFQHDRKQMGFWVGMEKSGRLPSPSDRVKYRGKGKGIVPADELAKFLGEEVPIISEQYREVIGILSSRGYGDGVGRGVGVGIGIGVGDGAEQDPTPTPFGNSSSNSPTQEPTPTQNTGTSPLDLARYFRDLLKNNPHASAVPSNWEDLFVVDVKDLLTRHTPETVRTMMDLSQTKENQKWYVRTQKLIKNETILSDQAKRVSKRGSTLPPGSGTPPALEYNKSKYAPSPEKVASRQRAMLEDAAELEEL
jgi:hypothetical protein